MIILRNKKLSEKITADLIKEAKDHPNGWVYKIDQAYDPSGDIRPEAIVGGWKVNENGDIVGSFIPNKNYVPSK